MFILELETMGWCEFARPCRARADVLARAARICCTRDRLEEAMADAATPARPVLIELARVQFADVLETTFTVILTPPPSR